MSMSGEQMAATSAGLGAIPQQLGAEPEGVGAEPDGVGAEPTSGPEAGGATNGDPEALSDEREDYPDPESYPAPETTDGETPDPDIQVDDPSGGEERQGRSG